MNLNNLTIKSQEALQRAQQLAMEYGQQAIEPGHLLKGILEIDDSVAPFVFKKLGVNYDIIRQALDRIVQGYPKVSGGDKYLGRATSEAIQKANTYLKEFGDEYIALEHLLLGLLATTDPVAQLLKDGGITEKGLKAAIHDLRKGKKVTDRKSNV